MRQLFFALLYHLATEKKPGGSMKFRCEKSALEKAISKIDTIILSRDSKSIYSNVLLTVSDKTLYLTASDNENIVRISLPVENAVNGEVLINARLSFDIARKIVSKDIAVEVEEKEVAAEGQKGYLVRIYGSGELSAKYQIPGIVADQFSTLELERKDTLTEIDSDTLLEMIRKTMYSISQEDNRYIFSGLCFIFEENNLTLVGTDGRRLAAITRKLNTPVRFVHEGDIVVHHRALREMLRVLEENETAYLAVEQREIYLRCGDAEMKSRLLEGRFPEYKKVIPSTNPIEFRIRREDFISALEQIVVVSAPPGHTIEMNIKSGLLEFKAATRDGGDARASLAIAYEGQEMLVGLNGSFLMDVVRSLDCEELLFGVSDPAKPVVIRDIKDPDFVALIMPVRL
ncbi:MAG: DNA polymerase III subunit beta [Leptospiraceae bacterium]|nr:DNA polymerase III subunit beta [Leptospiraceae bacterium]